MSDLNAFPSINRNGQRVAFVSDHDLTSSNPDNNAEIFLYDFSLFPPLSQVTTSSGATNGAPSINSDGTLIAFISDADLEGNGKNSDHSQELFLYNSQATPPISQLTTEGNNVTQQHPSINGDGTRIAFVSNKGGNQEIFLYNNGAILPITQTPAGVTNSQPALSRDGRRLVFVSNGNLDQANSDANAEIFVAILDNLPAITFTQVTSTPVGVINTEPTISRDGAVIAFASTSTSLNTSITNPNGNQEVFRAACEFADLAVNKSADEVGFVGQLFTYIFVVSNQGGIDFTGVTLTDMIPQGLTLGSVTGCDNQNPINSQTLNCQIDQLAAGTSRQVTLSVTPQRPGTFLNTASVTGTPANAALADLVPDNNNSSHVIYIDPANLKIEKDSFGIDLVSVGERLTYTIRVENLGPATATNVKIIDTLPPNVRMVFTPAGSAPEVITDDFNSVALVGSKWTTKTPGPSAVVQEGGAIKFTRGGHLITQDTLDFGQEGNGNIKITGVYTFGSTNDELVVLTRSDGQTDSNNETNAGVEFYIRAGKIDQRKSNGNLDSKPDEIKIRVKNDDTYDDLIESIEVISPANILERDDAIRFEITDNGQNLIFNIFKPPTNPNPLLLIPMATTSTSFPPGHIVFHNRVETNSSSNRFSFLDDVRIEFLRPRCRREGAGSDLECVMSDLDLGSSDIITLGVEVVDFSKTTIRNETRVEAAPQPDPDLSNNMDDDEVTLKAVGLGLKKRVTPQILFSGDPLTYTLTVVNSASSPFTNIVLTDTLPASLGSLVTTPSQGVCNPPSNGQIICALGSLTSTARATITIRALSTVTDTLVNRATVRGNEVDENLLDNTAVVTAYVNPVDLSLTKEPQTSSGEVDVPLVYSLKVSNNGPLLATNVTLTDPLPIGMRFASAVSNQGSCNLMANILTCALGSISTDEMVDVTLTVTPTIPGQIINNAQVTGAEPDSVPNNNRASASVTITGLARFYLPFILKEN